MSTFDELKRIFKDIIETNVDVDSITLDSLILEDLGLNSVGIMYLVLAIEEEFNIIMHNSSIEKFKKVSDVVNFIEENK